MAAFEMAGHTEITTAVRFPQEGLTGVLGVVDIVASYTFHHFPGIEQGTDGGHFFSTSAGTIDNCVGGCDFIIILSNINVAEADWMMVREVTGPTDFELISNEMGCSTAGLDAARSKTILVHGNGAVMAAQAETGNRARLTDCCLAIEEVAISKLSCIACSAYTSQPRGCGTIAEVALVGVVELGGYTMVPQGQVFDAGSVCFLDSMVRCVAINTNTV